MPDTEKGAGQGERILYYDLLRVAASFAVMIIHVAARGWYCDMGTAQWHIVNLYDGCGRWCVPVFVMISGALFLRRPPDLKTLYKKHILHMATAFAAWSFLYAALEYIRGSRLKDCLVAFLCGHYHLWFLYMIAGLYMIVPLLHRMAENEALTRYYLLLALIFGFALPQIWGLLSLGGSEAGTYIQTAVEQMNFHFVLGYPAYFLLGYYLATRNISKKTTRIICCLGGVGLLATVAGTELISRAAGSGSTMLYQDTTVNVMLMAAAVFVLFQQLFSGIELGKRSREVLFALSKYSFGAYLIHPLIIEALERAGLTVSSFFPLLSIPVISITVFVISYLISGILHRIPVFNKYVV